MCNILIVDNNHELRPLMVSVLAEAGYHVFPAGTKREAEVLIDAYLFDLAIIDTDLPNGEGITIARKMGKDLTKILLSEEGDPRYSKNVLGELGIVVVMDKPFSEEELVSFVDTLVDTTGIERRDEAARLRDHGVIKRVESSKGRQVGESVDVNDIYIKTAVVSSRVSDMLERMKVFEQESKRRDAEQARMSSVLESLGHLSKQCPLRGEEIKVLQEKVAGESKKWGKVTSILLTLVNLALTTVMASILARMLGIVNQLAP